MPDEPDEPDEPATDPPVPGVTAPADLQHHVIVCGIEHLGRGTIEELALGDDTVVAIAPAAGSPSSRSGHPGVPLVIGDFRREETLRAAGVADASAIDLMTGEDDLANLHAALAARRHQPCARASSSACSTRARAVTSS